MPQQKSATMMEIFSEVLANLAFMFSDEGDADFASGEEWLETAISYHGTATGALRLRCTREFSKSLCVNLLGGEPAGDEVEAAADDAVKEFMNIVCGQLITAWHGTDDVFNLSIPEIHPLAESPTLGEDDGQEQCVLCVEGQRVELTFFADESHVGI